MSNGALAATGLGDTGPSGVRARDSSRTTKLAPPEHGRGTRRVPGDTRRRPHHRGCDPGTDSEGPPPAGRGIADGWEAGPSDGDRAVADLHVPAMVISETRKVGEAMELLSSRSLATPSTRAKSSLKLSEMVISLTG